ncbi:hypothetical protein BH10ACT11_BH10ACT11_08350 [soil metagenome]
MITTHSRTPALRLSLAAAVLTALLALVSVAHATPPTITDTFNKGDDGWEIYEGAGESDAKWIGHGGNPGGFVRFADPDPTLSPAVFADEHYVSHISRYIGVGEIVFDLKTNGTATRSPRVWITDPSDPSFPAIHSTLGKRPNGSWRHYSLPIDATAARWTTATGKRVRSRRFEQILERDPVFVVRADYSRVAGEKTDFDSVGIFTTISRDLSLRFKAKTKQLKGRLTYKLGSSTPSCIAGQKVKIFKKQSGPDKKAGSATTADSGRYKLTRKVRAAGSYYAIAPESTPGVDPCQRAKSNTVKVKHH